MSDWSPNLNPSAFQSWFSYVSLPKLRLEKQLQLLNTSLFVSFFQVSCLDSVLRFLVQAACAAARSRDGGTSQVEPTMEWSRDLSDFLCSPRECLGPGKPQMRRPKNIVLDDTTMTLGWRKSFVFVLSWRFEDDVDDLDVDGFFSHSLQGLRRLRTSGWPWDKTKVSASRVAGPTAEFWVPDVSWKDDFPAPEQVFQFQVHQWIFRHFVTSNYNHQ